MLDRQTKILKSIIREYQRTGLPVSSQFLTQKYSFDFSPATVRNEMLKLDNEGYLEQPHTSAGRIPTDKAFRFFFEEFEDEGVSRSEREQIFSRIEALHRESMMEAAKFLAECSRNLGLSGYLGSSHDVHNAGFGWLADEPEFEDSDIRSILNFIDSPEDELNGFFDDLDEDIEVFIGRENPIKPLRRCSLMITAFDDGEQRGFLGILGPKRMNYQKNKLVLEEARKKLKNKQK